MVTPCDIPDVTPGTGFLICIPMLEEWSSGGKIDDLDGWAFQVRDIHHPYSVPG